MILYDKTGIILSAVTKSVKLYSRTILKSTKVLLSAKLTYKKTKCASYKSVFIYI